MKGWKCMRDVVPIHREGLLSVWLKRQVDLFSPCSLSSHPFPVLLIYLFEAVARCFSLDFFFFFFFFG
jgi:hypothetical protein